MCSGHTIQEVQFHQHSLVAFSREEIPQEGFESLHGELGNHVSVPSIPRARARAAYGTARYAHACAYMTCIYARTVRWRGA